MAFSVRSTFGWVGQVIAWLVILGVVVVLAAAVLVPRLAGATPYTVLTGSMQPRYPPGTLVVVKPVEFDEISVGQVITYQLESGKATVVTHRVVGVENRFDGTTTLITQGDANDDPDPISVTEVQVKGELWYSVPWLGHANTVLNGSQRQWAVLVVSALLIGYAAFMFVGTIRDRIRKMRSGVVPITGDVVVESRVPPAPALFQSHARTDDNHYRPLALAAAGTALFIAALLLIRTVRTTNKTGSSST